MALVSITLIIERAEISSFNFSRHFIY